MTSLVATCPFLVGTVLVHELKSSPRPPQTREEFEVFVRQMDAVLESQVSEIVELSPGDEDEVIRRRYREWREFVTLDCEIKGREGRLELAELRCLSEALERRYQDQEIRIVELEEERARGALP